MKRLPYLITCILIVTICVDASAQFKSRYRRSGSKLDFRFGVKLGYQMSTISGDDFLVEYNSDNILIYPPVTYKYLAGYHAGVYADIRLSSNFIIQPEIQFTQMGAEMSREADLENPQENFMVTSSSNPNEVLDIRVQHRLNYLQLPIVAKIGLNRLVHINVGPQLGFKLSENFVYGDVDNTVIDQLQFTDPEAPSRYQSLDYGAVLGLSVQTDKGFVFNLRYNRNFNNINKNEGLTITAVEPQNSTAAFLLGLGYTFLYDGRLKENIGRRY